MTPADKETKKELCRTSEVFYLDANAALCLVGVVAEMSCIIAEKHSSFASNDQRSAPNLPANANGLTTHRECRLQPQTPLCSSIRQLDRYFSAHAAKVRPPCTSGGWNADLDGRSLHPDALKVEDVRFGDGDFVHKDDTVGSIHEGPLEVSETAASTSTPMRRTTIKVHCEARIAELRRKFETGEMDIQQKIHSVPMTNTSASEGKDATRMGAPSEHREHILSAPTLAGKPDGSGDWLDSPAESMKGNRRKAQDITTDEVHPTRRMTSKSSNDEFGGANVCSSRDVWRGLERECVGGLVTACRNVKMKDHLADNIRERLHAALTPLLEHKRTTCTHTDAESRGTDSGQPPHIAYEQTRTVSISTRAETAADVSNFGSYCSGVQPDDIVAADDTERGEGLDSQYLPMCPSASDYAPDAGGDIEALLNSHCTKPDGVDSLRGVLSLCSHYLCELNRTKASTLSALDVERCNSEVGIDQLTLPGWAAELVTLMQELHEHLTTFRLLPRSCPSEKSQLNSSSGNPLPCGGFAPNDVQWSGRIQMGEPGSCGMYKTSFSDEIRKTSRQTFSQRVYPDAPAEGGVVNHDLSNEDAVAVGAVPADNMTNDCEVPPTIEPGVDRSSDGRETAYSGASSQQSAKLLVQNDAQACKIRKLEDQIDLLLSNNRERQAHTAQKILELKLQGKAELRRRHMLRKEVAAYRRSLAKLVRLLEAPAQESDNEMERGVHAGCKQMSYTANTAAARGGGGGEMTGEEQNLISLLQSQCLDLFEQLDAVTEELFDKDRELHELDRRVEGLVCQLHREKQQVAMLRQNCLVDSWMSAGLPSLSPTLAFVNGGNAPARYETRPSPPPHHCVASSALSLRYPEQSPNFHHHNYHS